MFLQPPPWANVKKLLPSRNFQGRGCGGIMRCMAGPVADMGDYLLAEREKRHGVGFLTPVEMSRGNCQGTIPFSPDLFTLDILAVLFYQDHQHVQVQQLVFLQVITFRN